MAESPSPFHLLVNGRIYQSPRAGKRDGDSDGDSDGDPSFAQCMLIQDGIIRHVGSEDDEPVVAARVSAAAAAAANTSIPTTDLAGRTVLPGFIDGHVHLLMLGQSLAKLDISDCSDISDIRARIASFARANPSLRRICCMGWQSNAMTPEGADASMLDSIDGVASAVSGIEGNGERPIFVDSKDLHSAWCNTAGLREVCSVMDIAPDAADPPGGSFSRDAQGDLNGVFVESAVFEYIWPFHARVASFEERKDALRQAIQALNSVGCTGAVDMAMDELIWEPLVEMRGEKFDVDDDDDDDNDNNNNNINNKYPKGLGGIRIAAYWLIKPSDSKDRLLEQVDRAAELASQWKRNVDVVDLRIVGVKVICDGTVDLCTASLLEPYSSSGADPDACWTAEDLKVVVARAQSRDLQVALHAIGDRTVRMAIDVLEEVCCSGGGGRGGEGGEGGGGGARGGGGSGGGQALLRPRIEHLELTTEQDAARLGKLGITASVQPVHSDPAGLRAWPHLIGRHRCDRAFAYADFLRGGAVLAIGSDAPTAPHRVLPNMYVATTGRSNIEPGLDLASVLGGSSKSSSSSSSSADDGSNKDEDDAKKKKKKKEKKRRQMISVGEALAAATEGSAYSTFAEGWSGSLRSGMRADFVVCDLDLSTPEGLARGIVRETWFEGKKVYQA